MKEWIKWLHQIILQLFTQFWKCMRITFEKKFFRIPVPQFPVRI